MIQRIAVFYTNYIKHYLFPHVEESDEGYMTLHNKKIRLAGLKIENKELTLDKRVQAARDVGVLGYTGGYAAATCAAEYMPTMVDFLKAPDLSDKQTIMVLEALAGVCYVHFTNQRQAHSLGLYDTLQELLAPTSQLSIKAKLWSCYLLNVLCCNNVPVIRTLISSGSLRTSLEDLEVQDWFGWPKNYAQELLCMLGFWPPQSMWSTTTEDTASQDSVSLRTTHEV